MRSPMIAQDVARGVTRLFYRQDLLAICEVPLPNGRRADMVALDSSGLLTIVEIKVSRADLVGDQKWRDYLDYCDRFYWAVPQGFALDLFLTTPLGLSALSYAITGYVVGLVQAGMVRRPPFAAPLIGGIGGFFGGLVFLAVGAVVGEAGFLSLASLKTVTIAALYDALIAPLVFPLVRRAARHPRDVAWRAGS